MSIVTLITGSVLLLAIIGVSVYGARVLPADAQLPLHLGPGGYTNWQSRNVGLLMWPLIAAAVWVIIAVSGGSHRPGSRPGLPLPIGLTIVLGLLLVSHVGAIRAALNRSARGEPGGQLPGTGRGAVAADGLAGGAGDLAGAVGVDGEFPAHLVQQDMVVPVTPILKS